MSEQAPKIAYNPAHPPRPCTPAEGVFLNEWRELMRTSPFLADQILWPVSHMTIPQEMFECVSASLMVYLGTNGGRSLIYECEAAAAKARTPADGYLQAWAIHNRRSRGCEHGIRAAEYILAIRHPTRFEESQAGLRPASVQWQDVPVVTQDEYDIFDVMLEWLSTPDGRAFEIRTRALASEATQARRAAQGII